MIRGRRKEKIAMNPDDEILRRKFMKGLGFRELEINWTGYIWVNGVFCVAFQTLYNLIKSAKFRESSRVKPKRQKLRGYFKITSAWYYVGLQFSLFKLLKYW